MSCIITYKGKKYSEKEFIKYLKKNPIEFRIPLEGLFNYRQERLEKLVIEKNIIPLIGNERLYKKFRLLNPRGKIKSWYSETKDAKAFTNRLNNLNSDYIFDLKQVAGSGKYQIMISKKSVYNPFDQVKDRYNYFANGNVTDAKSVLLDMIKNDPIPDLDDFAKRLLSYVEYNNVKITLVENLDQFKDLKEKYGENLRGVYTNDTNEIFVTNFGNAYEFKALILHEIVHALTVRTLKKNSDLKNQVTALLNESKKKVERSGRNFYALTNEYEFLSEAFTNKDFVKFLKSHKFENATLWDRFVDFIRSVFGKSLYDVTDEVLSKILNETRDRAISDDVYEEIARLNSYEDIDDSLFASIVPSGDPSIDSSIRSLFNNNDSTDTVSILKNIALSENQFSLLAKLLLNYSDSNNAKLQLVPVKSLVKNATAVGSYDHKTNTIKIAEFANHPDGNAVTTILHEILHSYTTGYLLNIESDLTKDFYDIFEYAKKNMDQNLYGMTDEFEFISEMFTNPEFVKEMQKLKPLGKGYMNLFEEFIEMITKLIGIPVQETFYDEAIALMSNLFVEMSDLNYKLDVIEKNKKQEVQYSKTAPIKEGVVELFESNPELANAVYEALGFNQMITPNDRIVFGHPGIGKTYLRDSGRTDVIDFDSDYKSKINEKFNLPKGFKARNEFQKNNKEEYQKAVRELWNEAKQEAKRTGKQLFASDMILLREFVNDFDKVLTMSKETFVERAKQRNDYTPGLEGTEGWKNSLDVEISKVDKSKVVNTDKYLSELFITPEQKQQAYQAYSAYLDTIFPDSKVKDIVYHVNKTGIISSQDGRKFYSTSFGSWLEELEEMKGARIPIILNITNPTIVDSYYEFTDKAEKFREFGLGDQYVTPDEVRESGTDSVIGRDSGQGDNEKTYVTYSSNQVYQLGSKQDIEGFKKFVNKPNSLFGLDESSENLDFHVNTINVVTQFLDKVGIEQRLVSEFLSQNGTVVENALAAANFIDATVDIIDDVNKRPSAWNKLPEEAAHWWYRLLKNDSTLKKALWESHKTAMKNNELYNTEYGTLVGSAEELTEESIGQIIAETIKRIESKNDNAADYSFFRKFLDWINELLSMFNLIEQDPFEIAAMKILSHDVSDLMTLDEYQKLLNQTDVEVAIVEDWNEYSEGELAVSKMDTSVFDSLLKRLKKKKKDPSEKTIRKIIDILSRGPLETKKLNEPLKTKHNIKDYLPTLLSFENFTKKYKNGIPAKDNLSINEAKAFDLFVYNSVRNLIIENEPDIKNVIPYETFIHYFNGFLEQNYLINFQVLRGFESYRIDNTFLDKSARHRKIGLRFNNDYFTGHSHFDLSPLAWGNVTYFKSDPNLSEPDSVLIHEIQNDFWEKLTPKEDDSSKLSIEELLKLPNAFKNLSDDPNLAYDQFKTKIEEFKELNKPIPGFKTLSQVIDDAFSDLRKLRENRNKKIVNSDQELKIIFDSINIYNQIELTDLRDDISEDTINRLKILGHTISFRNKPKSKEQLLVLLNVKLKKYIDKQIINKKLNISGLFKLRSQEEAYFKYDQLTKEQFVELHQNIVYNKKFYSDVFKKNQVDQTTNEKIKLWEKYFTPLVHHLIQTVISEKGKDFNIYLPTRDIVLLSQVQVPNNKTHTPTADLYAGENDVKKGTVKETGVMFRNMKKVNGIKLEYQEDIPGFVKPVDGYKINVSNYNYNNPILFGLDKNANKKGFKGYQGGFENKGKGTPQGDGKDKAMRKIATASIVEVKTNRQLSSSLTTLMETGTDSAISNEKDRYVGYSYSGIITNDTGELPNYGKVVMLARNGSLSGTELSEETKYLIDQANEQNVQFVVGDMPNVDTQFINYLMEIGATFTIFHTGDKPRIDLPIESEEYINEEDEIGELIFGVVEDDNFGYDEEYTQESERYTQQIVDEIEQEDSPLEDINPIYEKSQAYDRVDREYESREVDDIIRTMKFFLFYKNREVHNIRQLKLQDAVDGLQYLLNRYNPNGGPFPSSELYENVKRILDPEVLEYFIYKLKVDLKKIANIEFKSDEDATSNEGEVVGLEDEQGNPLLLKESYELTTYMRATPMIRLIMSSMPEIIRLDESTGRPVFKTGGILNSFQTANKDNLFKVVGKALKNFSPYDKEGNLVDSFTKMMDLLKAKTNIHPELSYLVQVLETSNIHIQTQFVRTFNNQEVNLLDHIRDNKSNVSKLAQSDNNTAAGSILNEWAVNFVKAVRNNDSKNAVYDEQKLYNITSSISMLNLDYSDTNISNDHFYNGYLNIIKSMGIPIDMKVLKNAINKSSEAVSERDRLKEFGNKINNATKNLLNQANKPISIERKNNYLLNETTFFRDILADAASDFVKSRGEDQIAGPDGKPKSKIQHHNTMSKLIAEMKAGSTRYLRQLAEDPFSKSSYWLAELYDYENDKINEKFLEVFKLSGFNLFKLEGEGDKGSKFSDLNEPEQLLDAVTKYMDGYAIGLAEADKSQQFYFTLPKVYNSGFNMNGKQLERSYKFEPFAIKYLKDQIYAEWERITTEEKRLEEWKAAGLQHKEMKDYHYKDEPGDGKGNYKRIYLLAGLNEDKLKELNILNENGKSNRPDRFVLDSKVWDNILYDEIEKAIQYDIDKFVEYGLINRYADGSYWNNLISNELLEGNNPKNKLKYNQITNFVADFTFMSIMSNIEQVKLFNGDPAFYKSKGNDWFSDFIKRIPAMTASGVQTVSRNDLPKTYKSQVIKNIITPSEYFSDVENLEKIAKVTKRDLTEIKNLFWGEPDKNGNYSKGYLDVNRTDAQAWISIDAWKTRLNYFGMWSDDHDIIFEKVKNKIPLTYSEKMIAMQPLKTVHVERTWQDNLPKMVYNKQSEALFLPEIFETGEIAEAINRLHEAGVDHLIVVDGRKVGASSIIDITDPNAIINPDELSYNHLMLQQELPTKGTKNILVGTQMIKNALLALQSGDVKTYQEYLQVHSELSNKGLDQFKEEIQYDEETNTYNKDILYDKLTEAFQGEVSDNVILALKNRLMFDSILSIKEKVQNRLMSTINSSTVNLKANGMALILMSDFGTMKMSSINRDEIVGNGVILLEDRKVDELQPMRLDKKTGKVLPAEALVPFTVVQKAFEKLGLDITKMTHKQITDLIDPKLLEGVGYRIPNQGPSSNAAIKIVGILPPWMGDTAIMSKEITTQMGSDFDIDKIFMILPEYWINDEQEGYVLNYIKPKKAIDEMNSKQLRNKRLELLRKIFLTPESYDKMMAPLDQDWLKDWVNENIPSTKKESMMSFWTGTHQTENKAMFDNAKTLVGVIANHMTHHAMMIHESIEDLSNIKNVDGEDIALILSAYMNAIVDAAKDPYVSRANVNQYTAGLVFMLNRHGNNKYDVLSFINQPIIRDLVKQVSINESRLNEDNKDTINEIAIKYGMNPTYKLSDYLKDFDTKDLDGLKKLLKSNGEKTLMEEMKSPNNDLQLRVLALFQELQKSARELNTFISASKSDVRGAGKNITQARLISEAVNELPEKFQPLFRDDHFIGTYHNNSVEFALKLFESEFIEATNAFVDTVNYLIDDRNVSINNSFEIDNINKELFAAILSEYDLFQIKDGIDYDSNAGEKPLAGFHRFLSTFPKIAMKMKKRYPNNNLLQNIAEGTELETGMDYLYMLSGSLSPDLKSDLYKDWEDILAFDEEFGENLIKYAFYTSGFRTSFGSFFQYIPTSWMEKENGLNQFLINKIKELKDPSYFRQSNHLEKIAGHLTKSKYVFKNVPKDQVSLIEELEQSDNVISLPKYNVRFTELKAPNFIKRRVFAANIIEEDRYNPMVSNKNKTFVYYMIAGYNIKGDPVYKRIQPKGKSTPHITYKEYGNNFNASLFDITSNEYFTFTNEEKIYLNSLLSETDSYITGADSNQSIDLEEAKDENKFCKGNS